MTRSAIPCLLSIALALALAACGQPAAIDVSAQLPPVVGADELEAWIATGAYLGWRCEPAPHPAIAPSPHEMNRTCANDLVVPGVVGQFSTDAAFVKETWGANGAITGYAVQRHTRPGGDADTWFWYRRVALDDTAFAHDEHGVVAIGWPLPGTAAATVCVACHLEAGIDGFAGHDFVFSP